ncbi:MAG: type II toxin-antitoxin system VapB family antitoxin [Deltaproteobacteria bacterium]|nr:type II toxin-antitoxin system VapB family antitoxin [Deltaproteobacteria bacterium]
MATHMKTTIDIADQLFSQARRLADQRGTTLKELVETALRLVLKGAASRRQAFRLQKHSFCGRGVVAGLTEGDWVEVRRRVYEGRGG